jgi:hypothetical protein
MFVGRATVPFVPIHMKDILFAIEGSRAQLQDGHAIPFEPFQIIAKCISGLVLRKKYDLQRDEHLLSYLEVSASTCSCGVFSIAIF